MHIDYSSLSTFEWARFLMESLFKKIDGETWTRQDKVD